MDDEHSSLLGGMRMSGAAWPDVAGAMFGWVALELGSAKPPGGVYRRMLRMQLYLPDDLCQLVKAPGLAASELLPNALVLSCRAFVY